MTQLSHHPYLTIHSETYTYNAVIYNVSCSTDIKYIFYLQINVRDISVLGPSPEGSYTQLREEH